MRTQHWSPKDRFRKARQNCFYELRREIKEGAKVLLCESPGAAEPVYYVYGVVRHEETHAAGVSS